MTTPTTAGEWLTEAIGEAEACGHCGHRKVEHFGQWCRAVVGAVTKDGGTRICGCEGATHDDPTLACLAALRAIVELHNDDTLFGTCGVCATGYEDEAEPWPCPTIRAVAEVFRGREGYGEWFGGGQ